MNPPVNPEHGLVQDFQGTREEPEYLRRMKEQSSAEPPSATAASAASPTPSGLPAGKERRRSPRFLCSGSAEFRAEGSDVRMWGTLSDVSLHGCYIEMANTFPVNTRVDLGLEAMDIRVHMQAVVRVSYPLLGMGLCFVNVNLAQRMQLERLLLALSGQAATPAAAAPATATHSLVEVDPQATLDALTEFFRTNALLSRTEFFDITKRARR